MVVHHVIDPEKIYPQEGVTLYRGGIGILECSSSTLATWLFYDNKNIQSRYERNVVVSNVNNTILVIRNVTKFNEGTYECYGSLHHENFITRSRIKVESKFSFIGQLASFNNHSLYER